MDTDRLTSDSIAAVFEAHRKGLDYLRSLPRGQLIVIHYRLPDGTEVPTSMTVGKAMALFGMTS